MPDRRYPLGAAMISREEAVALAELVHLVRPAWDTRAIVAALGAVMHRDLADTAAAALRCAANPVIRKPAVIPLEGDHWSQGPTDKTPVVALKGSDWCPVPGHSGYAARCENCRADQLAGFAPDPVAAGAGMSPREIFVRSRDAAREVAQSPKTDSNPERLQP